MAKKLKLLIVPCIIALLGVASGCGSKNDAEKNRMEQRQGKYSDRSDRMEQRQGKYSDSRPVERRAGGCCGCGRCR